MVAEQIRFSKALSCQKYFIRIDNEGEAILHIVDVLGRTVGIENVNESQIVSVNLKAGVYMLQLVQDQKVRTQKILVR